MPERESGGHLGNEVQCVQVGVTEGNFRAILFYKKDENKVDRDNHTFGIKLNTSFTLGFTITMHNSSKRERWKNSEPDKKIRVFL